MKKQLLLIFILSISILKIIAQKKRKFLYATIIDNINVIANAHIINTNTNQGTYSNEKGEFRILAKPNDSLKISFIGYKNKIVVVNSKYFGMQINSFLLKRKVIELNEVVIKKHNLLGRLELDIKTTPKNRISEMVNNLVNSIKKMKYNDILNMPIGKDELHLRKIKAPGIPNSFSGAGASVSFGLDRKAQEKRRMRKEISFKENFPKMLISEFGKKFFFKDLKIPREKYYHFLEYCNTLNIEELYKSNKKFKLIKVLQEESKSYLIIINSKK